MASAECLASVVGEKDRQKQAQQKWAEDREGPCLKCITVSLFIKISDKKDPQH